MTLSRARLTARLAVNLKGTVRQAQITIAGSEAGTFEYLLPRRSADLAAGHRVTRRLSAVVSGRNINEAVAATVRDGPPTPREQSLNTHLD